MAKSKAKKEKKTIPEEGANKYYVHHIRSCSYTVIGADNIHHAWNKATKLWGPYWDRVSFHEPGSLTKFKFVTVKEFGALIKEVAKLDL
jgi:hypothetical protein